MAMTIHVDIVSAEGHLFSGQGSFSGTVGCAFPAVVRRGVVHSAANIDASWLEVRRGSEELADLLVLAGIDPARDIQAFAIVALAVAFASATQDIVIDAYRIEAVKKDLQALMSATYVAGYRIGMIVAGAGIVVHVVGRHDAAG